MQMTCLNHMPLALVAVAALAAGCGGEGAGSDAPTPQAGVSPFVGAEVCGECHEERFEGFRHTGHHNTSRLPSRQSIDGSFDPPANRMRTRSPDLWFEMEEREDGFYQTAHIRGGGTTRTRSERIDFVLGSGKLGQTYLTWRGKGLYQLPISSMTAKGGWANSPGSLYEDGSANFDRPAVPRCLECHSTWFDVVTLNLAAYRKEGIQLGISCERCHGPGQEHVAHHRANPEEREGRHITHPADLPRERSLELCGQCHGGVGELVKDAFSYRPGEPLDEHVWQPEVDKKSADLHSANQLPRVRASRCFQESDSMVCATCHDPHAFERGDLARFSRRCVQCHQPTQCGMEPRVGAGIADNCIDCHMERVEIASTRVDTGDDVLHPTMRDHLIRVNRDATERFLAERDE